MAINPQLPKYIETMYGKRPWITSYAVDKFGLDSLTYDASNNVGSVLIDYPIGICMLLLCLLVGLIGIIYACCRCAGRCNPRKNYCESKWQKGFRWILSIIMIIIIILITYCLIIIIFSSWTVARYQGVSEHKREVSAKLQAAGSVATKALQRQDAEETTGEIEANSNNDTIANILQDVENDVKKDLNKTCAGLSNLIQIQNKLPYIENEAEELCYEILILSDYMRIQHRNITTILAQTKSGRKLIKNLDFQDFAAVPIAIDDILKLHEIIDLVNHTISGFPKKYQDVMNFVNNVNDNIKNVVPLYMPNLSVELSDELSQSSTAPAPQSTSTPTSTSLPPSTSTSTSPPPSISTSPAPASSSPPQSETEVAPPKPQFRNNANKLYSAQKPLWVVICEWICIIWIILICIILIVALIFKCCGKRHRHENRIFNQEIGSILFQIAAFMLFAYFLLVLIPFLWNFFNHVVALNGVCKLVETNKFASNSAKTPTQDFEISYIFSTTEDTENVDTGPSTPIKAISSKTTQRTTKIQSQITKTQDIDSTAVPVFSTEDAEAVDTDASSPMNAISSQTTQPTTKIQSQITKTQDIDSTAVPVSSTEDAEAVDTDSSSPTASILSTPASSINITTILSRKTKVGKRDTLVQRKALDTDSSTLSTNTTIINSTETKVGEEDMLTKPKAANMEKPAASNTRDPSQQALTQFDELASQVAAAMPAAPANKKDKIYKAAKRRLNEYLSRQIPNLHEIIAKDVNATYLTNVFDTVFAFANEEMASNATLQQLTICNLNDIKASAIESILNDSIKNRTNVITTELNNVSKFMKEDISGVLEGCLNELENIENYYRNNYTDIIKKITNAFEKVPGPPQNAIIPDEKEKEEEEEKGEEEKKEEDKKTVEEEEKKDEEEEKKEEGEKKEKEQTEENHEETKEEHELECSPYLIFLAYIWTWLIPLLLLLLPLIPIAIYLSRLYTCEQRKRLRAVPGRRCLRIETPPLKCEYPRRFRRTRRILLRIKFYFKSEPDC